MSLSLTKDILERFSYNNYFVETGTLTGGGVQIALNSGFKYIRSVEIIKEYHDSAKENFKQHDNIKLYFGDSCNLLWEMIEDINESITFFLDSHLAHQENRFLVQVPLLYELEIIKNHPIKNHTILIDDRRIFGFATNPDDTVSREWKNITEDLIISKIFEINPNYEIYFLDTTNARNDLLVAEIR